MQVPAHPLHKVDALRSHPQTCVLSNTDWTVTRVQLPAVMTSASLAISQGKLLNLTGRSKSLRLQHAQEFWDSDQSSASILAQQPKGLACRLTQRSPAWHSRAGTVGAHDALPVLQALPDVGVLGCAAPYAADPLRGIGTCGS